MNDSASKADWAMWLTKLLLGQRAGCEKPMATHIKLQNDLIPSKIKQTIGSNSLFNAFKDNHHGKQNMTKIAKIFCGCRMNCSISHQPTPLNGSNRF